MQKNKTTHRKRRRSESTNIEHTEAKCRKLDDFTVAEFKLLLSDPKTAFEGLKKYLYQTERYENGDSQLDITASYCLTTNEFTEILSVVNNIASYSNKEVYLVFDCLQIILTRVATDLKKYKLAAQAIVRCMLSSAMGSVHYQLTIKNKATFTKSALKLLIAIVQYADWAARETVTRLDLSQQNFLQLLNCKDLRVAEDVKMSLIRLVVALLLTGDKTIYKVILSKGAFWNVLFSILHGDKAECIVLILEALHQTIVMNESVSKTLKVHLFKDSNLSEIARLYSWTGPKKWNETLTQKKSKPGADKDAMPFDISNLTEEQVLVRETVNKFLVDLCSSNKHGICFFDKTYSISSQNANHTLTALLLSVQQQLQQLMPASDHLRIELIVSILKSCPDQLSHFLPALRHSSVPRPSVAWQSCTHFIKQIYSKQQTTSPALKVRYTASAEVLVSMMMATLLPSKEIWSNYCVAIKKPWLSVVDESLSLMNLLLGRFEATFEALEGFSSNDDNERQKEEEIIVNRMEYLLECKTLLREAAATAFPDILSIIECWNSIVKHEEVRIEESVTSKEKSSENIEHEQSEDSRPSIMKIEREQSASAKGKPKEPVIADVLPKKTMTEYLNTIMATLRLYSTLFPVTFQSCSSLDYSSLLTGIEVSKREIDLVKQCASQSDSEHSEEINDLLKSCRQLQMETLKLLSSSSVRLNELVAKVKGKPSALTLLLTMSSSEEAKRSSSVLYLITKLLVNSGLFTGAEEELNVWLKHVVVSGSSSQANRIDFFVSCIDTYVRSPYTWIENILKIQSEASASVARNKKKESKVNVKASADHLIKDIIDGEELRIFAGDSNGAMDVTQGGNGKSSRRLPFTALVPIALEKLKDSDNKNKSLRAFVDRTLVDVLHIQSDSKPLCSLLIESGIELELSCSLANRYTSITAQDVSCSKEFKKVFGDFSIGYDLLRFFFSSQTSQKNEKMESQILTSLKESEISLSNCQDIVRQALFYIAVDSKSNASISQQNAICLYVEVIHQALEKTWNLQEMHNKKTVDDDSADKSDNSDDRNDVIISYTQLDVYQQLCNLVCNNESILDCFLSQSQDSTNTEITEKISKLMALIIPHVSKPSNLNCMINKLMFYVKDNNADDWNHVVLSTIQGFLPVLSVDSLILICGKALSSISKSMSMQPKKPSKSPKKASRENIGNISDKLTSFVVSIMSHIVDSDAVQKLTDNGLDVLFSLDMIDSLGETNGDSIYELLARVVKLLPSFLAQISDKFLERCLNLGSKSSLSVVSVAVESEERFHSIVMDWFRSSECWKKRSRMFNYIGITTVVLQIKSEPEIVDDTFRDLVHTVYWETVLSTICSEESTSVNHLVDIVCMLRHLCHQSAAIDKLKDAWQKLSSVIASCDWLTDSHCEAYTDLLESILSRTVSDSAEIGEERNVYLTEFISSSVQALLKHVTLGKENSNHVKICSTLFDSICRISLKHSVACEVLCKAVSSNVWTSLVRQGLKKYYTDVRFLRTLEVLCGIRYKSELSAESDLLKVVDLHGMIISHSQFISNLLNENTDNQVKDALVSLLLALCKLDPMCCSASHIPVLMGAYQASLSGTDQKLLSLMQLYDQHGNDKSMFKPYLWGEKAVEYQTGKKHLGLNLWKEPTMDQILELLDAQKLQNSLLNFPLQRSLLTATPDVSRNPQYTDANCYDPAFLLPLFSCITEPQYVVYCAKFIQRHCLGYVLAALSSHVASVRSLAYHILAQFYSHVEGARFIGKNQVLLIFDLLRNSLHKKNDKLSCIITMFLSRAAEIVISPGHEMFVAIMSFLSLKPALDVLNVPEFYKLFFSSELSYKVERSWLISLLIDGLRETNDYHQCERRFIYKIILGFYDTPLCDQYMRVQILKFISKSVSVSNIAWDLIKHHSLLSYLAAISCRRADTSANQAVIESLFSTLLLTLWQTVQQTYIRQQNQSGNRHECLPPSVIAELILTCQTVICNFGSNCLPAASQNVKEVLMACKYHVKKIELMCNSKGYMNPIPVQLTSCI